MVERVKPVVRLTGRDGNAFAILGEMSRALKKSGYSRAERSAPATGLYALGGR